MSRAVAPRGPDSEGSWLAPGVALGHRRLKVIDLSDAAAQPLANEDGTVQVVFNGEIYNFADLRGELQAQGHRFRSRADTEVLVHGYEQWGDALLDRLTGMFAFGLWDARKRRFLAARDRMGKKPFYFTQVARAGRAADVRLRLGAQGASAGARFRAAARPRGAGPLPHLRVRAGAALDLLRGAQARRRREAGARPVGGTPGRRRRWRASGTCPFLPRTRPGRSTEAAAELLVLLRRAVERRLVADVPLGAFLSGGLDSSAVVALMAEIAGADRIKTFSLGFSDPSFDESGHARAVARHLGTDHHEQRLDAPTLLATVPEVSGFLDEPLGDASIVPTFLLSRFTRAAGHGGPERRRRRRAVRGLSHLPGRPAGPAVLRAAAGGGAAAGRPGGGAAAGAAAATSASTSSSTSSCAAAPSPAPQRHQRWLASFLPEELPALLDPALAEGLGDPLAEVDRRAQDGPARTPLDQLMDFYARFYLANDVNVKVDRAAGAVGLEVRAPLLDTDLVSVRLPAPARSCGCGA